MYVVLVIITSKWKIVTLSVFEQMIFERWDGKMLDVRDYDTKAPLKGY